MANPLHIQLWERQFERCPSIPQLLLGLNQNLAKIGMMLASMDSENGPSQKELVEEFIWWAPPLDTAQALAATEDQDLRARWGKHYDRMVEESGTTARRH